MNTKQLTKHSKFLSYILRHNPKAIDLTLDAQGWADVEELMMKANQSGKRFTFPILEEVVANNNKKRFAFNEDKTKIRANQGHSLRIDLGYTPVEPPEILYHGTATRFINSIRKKGLIKGSRHHVHLSEDVATAKAVGARHGVPVILKVKAKEMHKAGLHFYKSENGVWLTEHVPTSYLQFP